MVRQLSLRAAYLWLAPQPRGSFHNRTYSTSWPILRQALFGQQLLKNVPLAARIRRQLEDEPGGALPEDPFIDLLEDTLEADQAKRMLEVAIEWGRYGELYEYDYHTGRLKLPGTGNTKE